VKQSIKDEPTGRTGRMLVSRRAKDGKLTACIEVLGGQNS
jgi:hypothetical protein